MKCTDCKYCIQLDFGCSSYSVEGTDVDCLLNLNRDFPKDRWYGDDSSILFAKTCEKFTYGDSVEVDCDRDLGALEKYSDDEEIKGLLRVYSE